MNSCYQNFVSVEYIDHDFVQCIILLCIMSYHAIQTYHYQYGIQLCMRLCFHIDCNLINDNTFMYEIVHWVNFMKYITIQLPFDKYPKKKKNHKSSPNRSFATCHHTVLRLNQIASSICYMKTQMVEVLVEGGAKVGECKC